MIHPKMSLSLLESLILDQKQVQLGEEMVLVGNQECFPGTDPDVGHTVVNKLDAIPRELVGEVTDKETGINHIVCEGCAGRTIGSNP